MQSTAPKSRVSSLRGRGRRYRSWLRTDVIARLHCSHNLSRLLYKIYHNSDMPSEPFPLTYWYYTQPIPERSSVFAIIQHHALNFFVRVEFGFDMPDRIVVGLGPWGTGGHVRVWWWNVGVCCGCRRDPTGRRNLLGLWSG